MYRVLLADDEQIERMALAKRLKRHFCGSLDISEAVNGAEALETFKREKSQIVVMDISMPEMNGVDNFTINPDTCGRISISCKPLIVAGYWVV